MFQKPFRVKSQTMIKGSDRKKLRAEIGKQFPQFSEEELKNVVPNKEEMTVMKVYTHSGDSIIVYCLLKNPAFFEVNRTVYPTVYTLWQHPELMPRFATWPPVFKKLSKGADLMLPGVITVGEITPTSLGDLKKGSPCAVKLLGNKAPVAVGKTALSSSDMFEAAMRGKGVHILHTYQDLLWAHGDKSDPPLIQDNELLSTVKATNKPDEFDDDGETEDDDAGRGVEDAGNTAAAAASAAGGEDDGLLNGDAEESFNNEESLTEMEKLALEEVNKQYEAAAAAAAVDSDEESEESGDEVVDEKEEQDALLYHCFMCALKTSVKKGDLPLLTSKFFRSHMLPFCPKGKTLDVKKSSHKKLSKFLQSMQKRELISMKELTKGVDSITAVKKDNLELRDFKVPAMPDMEAEEAEVSVTPSSEYKPPVIVEMHMVTAVVAPVFKPQGFGRGSALTVQQARQVVTDYVQENNLYHPDNRGYVRLDPILSDAVLNKGDYTENLRWDDLFQRCLDKMSPAFQLAFPGYEPVVKKGKLESVTLSIAQRAGNKKITLIHNLESFGIDPAEFAHRVQVGVACSASVSPLPGKNKGVEVLVQGNQINYIANLLTDKYRLPKKYLQGTEKAKGGKKKKR